MSDRYPFGADTLIIPFTMVGGSMSPRRSFGMSRMRPAGELFRYGVVNSWQTGDEPEKATGEVASTSALDVTPFGAPIAPPSPDPYANPDVGGTTVRLGSVSLPVQTQVTADQLRAIMPHAGAAADRFAEPLNQAMAAHGINTPEQRAAFLAQVSIESNHLRSTTEHLNYTTAQRLQWVWPQRFPTQASTAPYLNNPEALANHVYAGRNGNGDEASGDGYRYRGRGLMQTTGRDNYRSAGFENNPEALEDTQTAANTAAAYWESHGLNGPTTGALDRAQFGNVARTVNIHDPNAQARWDAYQRALRALNAGR